MLIPLVVIVLLVASVGAIYFLLKSMGEDGIEAAAPGSCKSGKCGVRNGAADARACQREEDSQEAGLEQSDEVRPEDAFSPGEAMKPGGRS